jgi:hypothetical protein
MAAGAFFCGHVGRALNATEASEAWWAVKVSNLRPSACKAGKTVRQGKTPPDIFVCSSLDLC